MDTLLRRRTVIAVTAIFLLGALPVSAEGATAVKTYREARAEALAQCQGKFKGKEPTPAELKAVDAQHREWAKAYYRRKFNTPEAQSDPRRANLCGANLLGAKLSGAKLPGANLSGAELSSADLSGAYLARADLSGASLSSAKLSEAFLSDANLSGADLSSADLSGAFLWGANLSGAAFEPRDLPDVDLISRAENLSQMQFENSPQALVKLRKALKEAGYRAQEREVTYAKKYSELRNQVALWEKNPDKKAEVRWIDWIDSGFQYVFFELTTAWGMAPGRALLILVYLIPFFAVPYMVALCCPGKDGIWRIWNEERMRRDLGTKTPTRLKVGWRSALALGVYFSALSAFHIGWRDLNVGNWIARMQAREYTLRASGWVRSVSGVQSLISVYLLAIWAITYFGRPFE